MTKNRVTEDLIKFFCPKSLKNDLVQLAIARNISLSSLLRLIVTEYLKTKG